MARTPSSLSGVPESAKRMKMHYMKCEQVLTECLNTIDWVAFDAAGRRGPSRAGPR